MGPETTETPYTSSAGLAFTIRCIHSICDNGGFFTVITSADPGVPYTRTRPRRWYNQRTAIEAAQRFIEREFGDN